MFLIILFRIIVHPPHFLIIISPSSVAGLKTTPIAKNCAYISLICHSYDYIFFDAMILILILFNIESEWGKNETSLFNHKPFPQTLGMR
jgi:hypothetical protein